MIRNIIFDIDGTLADTSDDIIDALNFSLKKFGFKKKINLTRFKKVANKGSLHMIKEVLGERCKKKKEINDFFLRYYQSNICKKSKLKTHVLDFLKFCKKKNIKLLVSTNKLEENGKLLLMKLKILKFFNFVAGSDTYKFKKPNVFHFQYLKKTCNFKKKETLLIGDTEVDSKAAKNFNIRFVLIKNGYTTLKASQINSDFSVSDYRELRSILDIKSNNT